MPRVITATLTQCAQGKPLAVLENLPRDGAELRPSDLRRLARLLNTIAIDAEGFKANIEIPGIEFNGDKMDLDGMMLPKGSMIKGMNINATDKGGREHGTVVFDFASPMTPDALATHLLEQAPKSSWGSFSRSTALDGAIVLRGVKHDKGNESIEYRLVADGKAASRGTATIVSDDAVKSGA